MQLVCVLSGHRWTEAAEAAESDPMLECRRCHRRQALRAGSMTTTEAVNAVRRSFYMNYDTLPTTPFLRGRKHRLWDTFKN
jgi:hypothetical protein